MHCREVSYKHSKPIQLLPGLGGLLLLYYQLHQQDLVDLLDPWLHLRLPNLLGLVNPPGLDRLVDLAGQEGPGEY